MIAELGMAMKNKPFAIRVSSQKGGVGKTTIAVNLAIALSDAGYKVLLIDRDVSNPSVGFHLGLEEVNIGFAEFITGRVTAGKAIIHYSNTGLHVLPGTIHGVVPKAIDAHMYEHLREKVGKLGYDFVIMDTAPGELETAVVKWMDTFIDHAIVVTTPDLASVTAAIRLGSMYDRHRIQNDIVINRYRNRSYELSIAEIEESYGKGVMSALPEDDVVPESIAMHIPAMIYSKQSKFSKAIMRMAGFYKNKSGTVALAKGSKAEKPEPKQRQKVSIFESITRQLRRIFLGR